MAIGEDARHTGAWRHLAGLSGHGLNARNSPAAHNPITMRASLNNLIALWVLAIAFQHVRNLAAPFSDRVLRFILKAKRKRQLKGLNSILPGAGYDGAQCHG